MYSGFAFTLQYRSTLHALLPSCDYTGTVAASFPGTAAASFPPCHCTGTAAAPFPPRDSNETATTRRNDRFPLHLCLQSADRNAAVRLGHAARANLARLSQNRRNEMPLWVAVVGPSLLFFAGGCGWWGRAAPGL
ncbi:hypothetical protein NL676_003913 [Syzygium grande]|nr:hypothetical protein NL676_003913 [Syzygium grande]